MSSTRFHALIPAAGVGARLGATLPKQYLPLAGKPMLLHALQAFVDSPQIDRIHLVVSAADGYVDEALSAEPELQGRVNVLRCGGETRKASVLNGLRTIAGETRVNDWILVHDAARPGLTPQLVSKLIDAVADSPVGGLLALPVVDTLKAADANGSAERTVPRAGLWAAQTPQMFRHGLLLRALEAAGEITDDASAIEALGLRPLLIEGSPRNFKVTLPHDIALAELYLKGQA
ncbi:2-C-methyl-D-erythritol 4-phosphate cytidylyltransferase [Noviherbaspirillum humi]|uniref:2-C-methyl-D-erythritol 4-phosphate cytidylyltransferase n=1 Tax=Noviherbaspirillum humi TaxID=1688639 RepID=A0A239H457_9BURK|nr:2-C-methyl-D-erythritol 4-phosphate cytidylyltransferase [Noviherbaspirillum humi]SNS76157.1 2-C-methyl-D-erythritol 4-phosphate cytidylyltransferase [Noviherbaspirillum humi]